MFRICDRVYIFTNYIVTGEANFSMDRTSLTVGGFNQPAVARCLLEMSGNAEKGLSQRFLWLFPKPVYGEFKTLEPSDKQFTDKIGMYILCTCTYLCSYIHSYMTVESSVD